MVSLQEFINQFEKLYPIEDSETWDYPGLINGKFDQEIKKVYLTIDPTLETINQAIEERADLIISHHPLFFKSVHNVSPYSFRGEIINQLIQNNIALYIAHTNADSAKDFGTATKFLKLLEIKESQPIIPQINDIKKGIGAYGKLPNPLSLKELTKKISEIVPKTHEAIKVAGPQEVEILNIGALPGSGDDPEILKRVRELNLDVYITSDLRHHPALDFEQQVEYEQKVFQKNPTYLISVPHYACEFPVLQAIQENLSSFFPQLQFSISTINTNPWTFSIE